MSLEYKVLGQDAASTLSVTNDGFVAVSWGSSNVAAHSTDGTTWTQTTLPTSANYTAAAYGGGTFVALSSFYYAAYSADGLTWTSTYFPKRETTAVAYGNGTFVAVSSYGYGSVGFTSSSSNGIDWIASDFEALQTGSGGTTDALYTIAHGDGKFLAVGYNNAVASTTGGITWTDLGPIPFTVTQAMNIVYGNGVFLAVSNHPGSSLAAVTADSGASWTEGTMPTQDQWAVAYGNGVFVAVSYSSGGSTISATSTDGISWTQTALPTSAGWNAISYGLGKFVATAGYTDAAASSTDGVTWTQTLMPANIRWEASAYGSESELLSSVQYTVPATKEAITSSIYIANNSSTSQTYSVAVVPDGETLSSIHYIRKDVTIDANDFHDITNKITLSAGDQVITDGSSTDVSINVFGVEK